MTDTTAPKKISDTKTETTKKSSQTAKQQKYHATPFSKYFNILSEIDKNKRYTEEFGSILILGLVEEVGEMARAYLAEHGRKRSNLAAQQDESYTEELGDLLLTILRFARIKKINLDERLMYSLNKVKERQLKPKTK